MNDEWRIWSGFLENPIIFFSHSPSSPIHPTFPVYRKFYGGFIRKTRSESPRHAKILATKDFVPKPEGKSFKTAWIHKSTFFKEIPLVRPNVPSNQQKALCEPGTKYPTQIPKPRECRLKEKVWPNGGVEWNRSYPEKRLLA